MKKSIAILMVLMCLLTAACGKAAPEETAPPTETLPVQTETVATEPEETLPEEPAEPEHWYHLQEWNGKLQLRCLVRNYDQEPITMVRAEVSYYQGEELVESRVYEDLNPFLIHLESSLEVAYGDGCVLLISDPEMEGSYDRAVCEIFVADPQGQEASQIFRFTRNEEEATPYSFDDRDWDQAYAMPNNGWNYEHHPHNDSQEPIHYVGMHRFTYYNGLPVVSDFFDRSFVNAQYLETFGDLAPGETGIYITGTRIFPENHPHNEEENVLVYQGDSGEIYLKSFHFVLDEERNVTMEYEAMLSGLPEALGTAQYTLAEIRQMVADDLTLDEVAEKISTYPDLIIYLKERGYTIKDRQHMEGGWYNSVHWGVVISPQKIFSQNYTDCGSANLVNYILRNDYDEQGYVREVGNETNHIYNYFKQDGVYYFVDFPQFYNGNSGYQVFITEDPARLGQRYADNNAGMDVTRDKFYIIMAYMFPWEDRLPPIAKPSQLQTPLGCSCFTILSDKLEGIVDVLYLHDEAYAPVYMEAIPVSD